jgi:hypothetical protein
MFKKCSSLLYCVVKLKEEYAYLLILLECRTAFRVLPLATCTKTPYMNKQNTAETHATGRTKCYSCVVGKTPAEESCTVSIHKKHRWILSLYLFSKRLLRNAKRNSEKHSINAASFSWTLTTSSWTLCCMSRYVFCS